MYHPKQYKGETFTKFYFCTKYYITLWNTIEDSSIRFDKESELNIFISQKNHGELLHQMIAHHNQNPKYAHKYKIN